MSGHNFKVIELKNTNILSFDGILPYNMANQILWPNHYGLGLLDGDKACGVLMMLYDQEGAMLVAYFMHVDEAYRNAGGGSLLLEELEQFGRKLGAEHIKVRYFLPADLRFEDLLLRKGFSDINPDSDLYNIPGDTLKDYLKEQSEDPDSIFARAVKKLKKSGKLTLIMMSKAAPLLKSIWKKHFTDGVYPQYLSPMYMTGTIEEETSVFLTDGRDVVGFAYTCIYEDGSRHLAGAYVPEKYRFLGGAQMIMLCLMRLGQRMKRDEEVFLCTINEQSRRLVRGLLPEDLKDKVEVEQMCTAEKQVVPASFEITEADLVFPRINGIRDLLTELDYDAEVELLTDGIPAVMVDVEGFPVMSFSYVDLNPETMDDFLLSLTATIQAEDPKVVGRMISDFDAVNLFVQTVWDEENGEILFASYQSEDQNLSSPGALAVMIGELERTIVRFEQMYAKEEV